MAGPFYIYIHGRWAEIDIETGKVCGSRKTKFMFVKDGKLVIAKTKYVLASLKALAAGKPSSVRIGATLPAKRRPSFKKERRRRLYEPCMRSYCCNAGHHGCSSQQQPIIVTQQVLTNNVGNEPTQFNEQALNKKVLNEQNFNSNILNFNQNSSNDLSPHKNLRKQTYNKRDLHKQSSNEKEKQLTKQNATQKDSRQPIALDRSSSESPCKELFIDYYDCEFIKNFCIQNPEHCKSFQLDRFEEDMEYRTSVLFQFNPLVKINKSKKIEKLLGEDQDMSLKEFAATLGLTHIDDKKDKHTYKTRQNIEKTKHFLDQRSEGKENFKDFLHRKKQTVISDTDSFEEPLTRQQYCKELEKKKVLSSNDRNKVQKERKRLRPAKPISTKMSAAREYSNLEDHAIISWLSVGGRSRKVNGNRLWRELQSQYQNLTSVNRSWHSLRNRYLRYILPSLGHLMLEPKQQARLRADAARGEIKLARKKSINRRNSIFENEKVESASARRPKATPDHKDEDHNRKKEDQTKKVQDQTKKVTEEQAKKILEDQVKKNIERLLSKPVVVIEKGAPDKKETPVPKSPSRRAVLSLRRAGPSLARSRLSEDQLMAKEYNDAAAGKKSPILSLNRSGPSLTRSRLSGDQQMAKEFNNAASALARRRSPPSYSALTREFVRSRRRRLSADTKSTPSPQPKETKEPETKKRRLFNPRAVWSPITKKVEITHDSS